MAAQDIAKKDPFKTPPRVDDDDDDDETVEKKAFPKPPFLSAKRRSSFAVRRDAIIEPIFSRLSRRALRLLRCDTCTRCTRSTNDEMMMAFYPIGKATLSFFLSTRKAL